MTDDDKQEPGGKFLSFLVGIFTLLSYCSPCVLAIYLFIFLDYKQRTEDVARQLKRVALAVESGIFDKTIEKSDEWKNLPESNVVKEIVRYFEIQKQLGNLDVILSVGNEIYENIESDPDRKKIRSRLKDLKPIRGGDQFLKEVQQLLDGPADEAPHLFTKYKRLIVAYAKAEGSLVGRIDDRVDTVWQYNAYIVSLMVLLPYLLLGSRLATINKDKIGITNAERFNKAWQRWFMKFLVACVITFGWLYVFNPLGRGGTTMKAYLIAENVITLADTLPIYVRPESISHTVAGFLGWYLYLLLYFFGKLYHDDVLSARVYRFLFGKFLFTYGAALILSSVTQDETKMALFLIGFFPLSAISILKEYGQKAGKGLVPGTSGLSQVLGISSNSVLRLEEEGIRDVETLASTKSAQLKKYLPEMMRNDLDEWIDKAQLCSVLGGATYENISPICITASEFKLKEKDTAIMDALKAKGVENPSEILRLLRRRFKGKQIRSK